MGFCWSFVHPTRPQSSHQGTWQNLLLRTSQRSSSEPAWRIVDQTGSPEFRQVPADPPQLGAGQDHPQQDRYAFRSSWPDDLPLRLRRWKLTTSPGPLYLGSYLVLKRNPSNILTLLWTREDSEKKFKAQGCLLPERNPSSHVTDQRTFTKPPLVPIQLPARPPAPDPSSICPELTTRPATWKLRSGPVYPERRRGPSRGKSTISFLQPKTTFTQAFLPAFFV